MTGTARLPARPGTYVLVILNRGRRTVSVGRLGACTFPRGWYLYTGSAFGPGGLAARAGRHTRPDKPRRWHIDYLTAELPVRKVWLTTLQEKLECSWARTLTLMGGSIAIPGFGASDCDCKGHLLHFNTRPSFRSFAARTGHPVRSVNIL